MNERFARGREAFPPKCRDYSPSRSSLRFPRAALEDTTHTREAILTLACLSDTERERILIAHRVSLPIDTDDAP